MSSSEKRNSQVIQAKRIGRRTSIFAVPWMVSIIMNYILFKAVSMTTPRYGIRSCMLAAFVVLIWTVAFFYHQRRVEMDESAGMCIKCNLVIVLIIVYFIGIFLAYLAWNSGTLSLVPYERIDNGSQKIDTMFHSSVAESWRRSLYPSTLLNDERYLAYHTFSHLLIGTIAGVMGMPSLIAYCYLYPVLFLPVHCFSVLLAVSSAKAYFESKSDVQFLDMIVIGLYIFGVANNIAEYGVWKRSYFTSESFLTANTISLLACALAFYALRKWNGNKRLAAVYYTLIIPIEIFVISWSKISVGFVFTAGIMYFMFRSHIRDFKFWLLDIFYLGDYVVCLRLFNNHGGDMSGTISSRLRWFAFEDYISGGLGMWGHYIVLSLMTMLFIGLEIYRNRFKWSDVRAGRTIWIEDIIIISVLAFLPGTIMLIEGGSAAYFSFAIEIPSLVLLCGHNYINIDAEAKGALKPLIYVVCLTWCMWMGYHNKPENPLNTITNVHESNLSGVLLEIRDTVGKNPEDYTIYLDTDSVVSQIFTNEKIAVFVCPAMTGVGVINATYVEEGAYYSYAGGVVGATYGFDRVDNGHLSYEDAISVARERGKKNLIHFTSVGYEIVNLE